MNGTARWLFVATILVGSFLLFLVQPMVARMALPRLGGAPAVWNSAMVVYQALLLAGYAYAHFLSRWPIRRQAMVHLAVLVVAGLTLPITLAALPPAKPGFEALWVPLLFLATIGPVFFAVSAQAPLMQRWYAANPDAGDPYWLYAASNLGSFGGLIAYPLLLEPNASLATQSHIWVAGYILLVALVVLAAFQRRSADSEADGQAAATDAQPIGAKRILLWLALAAVPSGLMLSTTTHLTTDIMAMPLLWVIPLGLYLLSFTFAFNANSYLGSALARSAIPLVLLGGATAMVSQTGSGLAQAFISALLLFVLAVALHRRLYLDRPDPAQLTLFYLVMSAGGVLGGIFAGLVAPMVFDWTWEHPLLVLAAAALLPNRVLVPWAKRLGLEGSRRRQVALVIILVAIGLAALLNGYVIEQDQALIVALMIGLAICGLLVFDMRWAFLLVLVFAMFGRGGFQTLRGSIDGNRERSYFGIYEVRHVKKSGEWALSHGTTLHGRQFTNPSLELEPTTYYTRSSGAGLALNASRQVLGPGARVGVIGLGVGTLACYRKPDESYEFFEIDPVVLHYSQAGPFTYMRQCVPDAPVHIGDARMRLETIPPGHFDALVVDAFSSDAIPLHLLTNEAIALYSRATSPDGLLLVHISNRFIKLAPVLARLAEANGLEARIRSDVAPPAPGATASNWIALSRDKAAIERLMANSPPQSWAELPPPADRLWTDDFASIVPFIEWENVIE